mgnify:CR=1 FL=1
MSPVDPIRPLAMPTRPAPEETPAPERVSDYRLLLILAASIFVIDQLSKEWIAARLPFPTYGPPDAIPVISGFFYLIHVGNTGAAWSMFAGQSLVLGAVAALTLGGIFYWRKALGLRARFVQICFGLLCGGILGNLVDRFRHQHVVDFLDFHFGSYVYPTFNIADCGICVGVVLFLWHSLREPKADAPRRSR